ncbi:MAG: signal recognition particle-docking protein FtsY [Erysipelotrichaceae bacterium]|nr:signal recognition particle-docking protein FtsY [Erysipelotrichaceae bacterium]
MASKRSFNDYLDNRRRLTLSDRIIELLGGKTSNNDDVYEQLLVLLIQADVGVDTAEEIIDSLKEQMQNEFMPSSRQIVDRLCEIMIDYYHDYPQKDAGLIMLVGVNESGKTTTIAKLANYYRNQGKSVGVIAADTFRAGAVSQLQQWADRLSIPCINGRENADPSSVLVDGCRHFRQNPVDIIIADTAGRMQNKNNLMKELEKMIKVTSREIGSDSMEILLTLDSTIGQNSLSQAEGFLTSGKLSGIILTKMDGSSKGGIVLAVNHRYDLPVRWLTYGENVEAIEPFDIEEYINSLVRGS